MVSGWLTPKKKVVFPNNDPMMQAMRDGAGSIDMNEYLEPKERPLPLTHIMLGGLMRNYMVSKVKKPLMDSLIKGSKLFPEATRENTYNHNTHVLMDIFDEFFKHYYNPNRKPMMEAAERVTLAEIEHDIHYAWILNYFAERIHDKINSGDWLLNEPGFPMKGCWKEDGEEEYHGEKDGH